MNNGVKRVSNEHMEHHIRDLEAVIDGKNTAIAGLRDHVADLCNKLGAASIREGKARIRYAAQERHLAILACVFAVSAALLAAWQVVVWAGWL